MREIKFRGKDYTNKLREERKVIDLLKNIDKQKCIMLECPVVKNNIERQLKIIELNRTIRKQSKEIERNKENWLLAQNEILGYAQGYEDGKKHQQTATAMVVENRQYQMIAEEIKRYKAIIEKQQKELEQEKEKNKGLEIRANDCLYSDSGNRTNKTIF